MTRCAILSIGDEVVDGRIMDANARWLAAAARELGLDVLEHACVADDRSAIVQAITRLAGGARHILTTGGLGPTPDDLTRFAALDLLGEEELAEDDAARAEVEAWCARRGLPASEARRLVWCRPEDADFLPNAHGTAAGLRFDVTDATVWMLPGPPGEMHPMFQTHVAPHIAGTLRDTGEVCAVGLTEVQALERLDARLDREGPLRRGIRVGDGMVRVCVEDRDGAGGVGDALADVREVLWPWSLPQGVRTPAEALGSALQARDAFLVTAESCTGGGIGQAVTACAGSSAWYVGGWVTYADRIKVEHLGVPAELLDASGPGAVSAEVAEAMAWGARDRSGATLAISVTGIAGPDGGSADKPVGTVWMALADEEGTALRCIRVPGDRAQVRRGTVLAALQWARWRTIGADTPMCWDVRS